MYNIKLGNGDQNDVINYIIQQKSLSSKKFNFRLYII